MKQSNLFKLAFFVFISTLMTFPAGAAPPPVVTDDPNDEPGHELSPLGNFVRSDPSASRIVQDAKVADIVSDAPFAKVIKNLAPAGRGERLSANSTTDVWVLGKYAYTGTFNNPCGGEPVPETSEAGIWIWDVHNKNKPEFIGIIQSPPGSRTNDVRVATMGSGDILVHSNESCGGGPGGYEVYNVDDPANPVSLASVRIDDPNPLTPFIFGPVTDVGVHNLWLFSQGAKDYVAVTTETAYGNFHIYDITDPANPVLESFWGAEESFDPGVVASGDFGRNLDAAIWLTEGFGASQNRFLHDVTINADGTRAYLANWDAGLILLDISDPANPSLVSVAIDPTSEDGEVNSHSVWPNADGSIVVEGEEDFSPFESQFTIDTGVSAGTYTSSEGAITTPIVNEPGAAMTGQTTYVGLACNGATVPSGIGIALIQRGDCAFTTKGVNAAAAGYTGMVVFNDEARGEALVTMGGTPVPIPGVFVGHSTGLAIMGVASAGDLVIDSLGETITAAVIPNGWSGMRIWSYADPANPMLMSTFNTVCSASPTDPSCDARGTYSSHNVIVEDNKAYISWYSDGVVVIDVSDPANPIEVARYHRSGAEFEAENGGIQDIWGIYKIPNQPWIYASDRNGGLYVLKEYGAGSANNGGK